MAERGHRKVRSGYVTSDKAEKTITVVVETTKRHPLYKKISKQTKKFAVEDSKNEANIGDLVEIMETRPVSKTKRWRLAKVIEKAK